MANRTLKDVEGDYLKLIEGDHTIDIGLLITEIEALLRSGELTSEESNALAARLDEVKALSHEHDAKVQVITDNIERIKRSRAKKSGPGTGSPGGNGGPS